MVDRAELGSIVTQPDGSELILGANGWIPNTPELEEAASLGALGGFLAGTAEVASMGAVQAPEEMSVMNPVATMLPGALELGAAATGVGALGLGLAKQGVKRGASTMAERVAERQLVRRPSDMMGGVSGRMVKGLEGASEAVPGLNFLPLAQKAVNQRRINMSAARALGLSDNAVQASRGGLTPNLVDEALTGFENGFDAVRQGVTKNIDSANIMPVIDTAIESKLLTGKLARRLQDAKQASGKEVMEVRSKMTKIIQGNDSTLVKEQAQEIIEEIDDIIEAALGTEGKAQYQALRSRYRVWAELRSGRSLSGDGQVNPRSLGGRLARNYGDNYRAGRDIKGATPEVNDFLKIVREGEALDVGLPNSGTAERSVMTLLGAAGIGAATSGSD